MQVDKNTRQVKMRVMLQKFRQTKIRKLVWGRMGKRFRKPLLRWFVTEFNFYVTPIRKFYKLGEKPSVMPINMDDIWLFQENKFPFGISSACFKILILLAP